MKLFVCAGCQQVVHFENSQCTRCGHALAYLPDRGVLAALEPVGDRLGLFRALAAGAEGERYRTVRQSDRPRGVQLGGVRGRRSPVLSGLSVERRHPEPVATPKAKDEWLKLEQSKRRTLYTLLQLGLPVEPRGERPEGLAFAFKQDLPGEEKVLIGHEDGLITINVAEADSPFREKTRLELGESLPDPARPLSPRDRALLLGSAHQERGAAARAAFRELLRRRASLVRGGGRSALPRRRAAGLAYALRQLVRVDAPLGRLGRELGALPAHGRHAGDGAQLRRFRCGRASRRPELEVGTRRLDFDDFADLARAWVPLTVALNALNRSMGLPDPLSVRALRAGAGEDQVRSRRDRAAPGS